MSKPASAPRPDRATEFFACAFIATQSVTKAKATGTCNRFRARRAAQKWRNESGNKSRREVELHGLDGH